MLICNKEIVTNNSIMKKITIVLFFYFGLTAFMPAQNKTRIVFFGDSITEAGVEPGGYITKIKEQFKQLGIDSNYELIGAGVGGNKVYDLYLRMDEDVLSKNPDVVVIWIGVNDVWHKRSLGTGTDAEKFIQFYNAIIKKLQDKKIHIILCTPAVVGEKTDMTNELDGDLNKYSAIIREIAKSNYCRLIDFRKIFIEYNLSKNKDNMESGILTKDKVHLNSKGNEIVAKEILKAIL